ncbi:MAG: cyclic nucleotide-binding/CBS domain-containing protein [Candidatus Woesearchaeota archaeon]
MRKYLVRDIMTTTPVAVEETTTAKQCAETMAKKEVGSLIIMKKQTFAGIITEQDLTVKVVSTGLDPNKILAKDIMTTEKNIISIEPGRSIYTAMMLMNNNDVRRLPVIEEGNLKGIVTMKDIFGIEPDLLDNMFEYVIPEQK